MIFDIHSGLHFCCSLEGHGKEGKKGERKERKREGVCNIHKTGSPLSRSLFSRIGSNYVKLKYREFKSRNKVWNMKRGLISQERKPSGREGERDIEKEREKRTGVHIPSF